tara:strand:- start:4961 stop:5800 length:840 start_codon:yes stop_codon:yes gene_type:complete
MIHILYNYLSSLRYKSIKAKKDYISSRNIYVVGYPISGNSWIAYLITYIMNCKYFDIDALEWSDQRVGLKKYLNGSNKHNGSNIFDNVYKTHSKISMLPNKNNDVIIYIVRDIRDVCNSYFHRFEKVYTISNSQASYIRRFIYFVYKRIIPYKFRYNFLIKFFAHEWLIHKKELYENEKAILVLYEDMIDNPLDTLERIINQIDPSAWNESIAVDAIEKFSLNNMKKVATKSGNNILKTDRVGTYGDWKNHFSKKNIKFFKKKYMDDMKKLNRESYLKW